MKILYLTPGCFDKGGISRYNRYQITALRTLLGSEQVRVFSAWGPDPSGFECPFEATWSAGGIGLRQKAAFTAKVVAAAAMWRPDVIFAAHVNYSGLGSALARATGALAALNVYGLEVWSGFRRDASWGLRSVDYVVADCHFTARYLEATGLRPKDSVAVVWDPVDLDRFHPGPPDASVLRRYGIPNPELGFNLLTFGRMSPDARHKGYERLLEVFGRVAQVERSVRLIFAGGGDLASELRQRAAAMGLSDRTFFTGAIHEDHLRDLYASAHLFSLVSDRGVGRGEGIPLTPLEAAACGVPILVGNQDGSQEAVDEGRNGLVLEPFDLDGHAQAILDIVRDHARREAMGTAARRRTEEEFSFGRFVQQHRAILSAFEGNSRIGGRRG